MKNGKISSYHNQKEELKGKVDQRVYWNRRSTLELNSGVYHADVYEDNHHNCFLIYKVFHNHPRS